MGRRKRKVIKLPKRKLPQIYLCPKCGEQTVKVMILKEKTKATVQCGKCGLKDEFIVTHSDQPVDIYCKFTDNYYSGLGASS